MKFRCVSSLHKQEQNDTDTHADTHAYMRYVHLVRMFFAPSFVLPPRRGISIQNKNGGLPLAM